MNICLIHLQALITFLIILIHQNITSNVYRQSIPLKRNTRYLVRQHRMALVHLCTEAHHAKRVNSIVHGFQTNIYQVWRSIIQTYQIKY